MGGNNPTFLESHKKQTIAETEGGKLRETLRGQNKLEHSKKGE